MNTFSSVFIEGEESVQRNVLTRQLNGIPRLTFVSPHIPRCLQGYSLELAGLQIPQRSSPCHKLLMDDGNPRKGCGCLPPEARITDGQWALPLNTHCP